MEDTPGWKFKMGKIGEWISEDSELGKVDMEKEVSALVLRSNHNALTLSQKLECELHQ